MKVINSGIKGLVIIDPKFFNDEWGYFFESINEQKFIETVYQTIFVQDNESMSNKGVLRGLHYQLSPFSFPKLVRVIKREV